MVPFAAKFGHSEQALDDRDLEDALRDEYARTYGHDPAGNWILLVFADGSSEIHRFERRDDMWCCELKLAIGAMMRLDVESFQALTGLAVRTFPG